MNLISKVLYLSLAFISLASYAEMQPISDLLKNCETENPRYYKLGNDSIYASCIGSGKPLVVLHGGPGFDHGYLAPHLKSVSEYRTVIYFDQLGSGWDRSSSIPNSTDLQNQLEQLITELELEDFGLLAHSWGGYLALDFLENAQAPKPNELYLVHPFPLTKARLADADKIRVNKFPTWKFIKAVFLLGMNNDKASKKAINLLTPYYLGSASEKKNVTIPSFNGKTYNAVMSSLGDFDIRDYSESIPEKTVLILGEEDFVRAEHVEELVKNASSTVVLPGVGHYGFAESPSAFLEALDL